MTEDCPDVTIVGMGPVGLSAALMLASRGLSVTVLEAGDDLAAESRASTFHPSSLEILDRVGVADDLLAVGLRSSDFQYRSREGDVIAHFDLGLLSADTAFPFRIQCEQSKLTRIIQRTLDRMPNVALRFGSPVERVEEGTDRVHIFMPGDGLIPRMSTRWLIGADGANSVVRRSLGIAFEGVTYPERFLVVSTEHDFSESFPGLSLVSYIYDPEDWGVLLRTPEHWRVLFPVREDESDSQARADDRVEQRLQGVCARTGRYPVTHSSIYAVHQRVASTFARGRILLAGDAAHINNPLGGLGMNSGIHDAEAAVDAIGYVMAGGDQRRAIETYSHTRRDAARLDVQAATQKNYDDMRQRDVVSRNERRAAVAAMAADPRLARQYLLGTSMLRSREISRGRMRRALSPARIVPQPAGRLLSEALRDIQWGRDKRLVHLRQTASASIEESMLAAGADALVIAQLEHDVTDLDGVRARAAMLEHLGAAAVEIVHHDGADLATVSAAVASAHAVRRDMLVLATTGPCSGDGRLEALITQAAAYQRAGADVLGLVGVTDVEELSAIHHAVPDLPIALMGISDHDVPDANELELAGVRIAL